MAKITIHAVRTGVEVVAYLTFGVPIRTGFGFVLILGWVSPEVLPIVGVDALGPICTARIRTKLGFEMK